LRMRVIEDTLAAFNVRARVVGSHTGPTITQFDVQPERGTRVQRVTALQNDLALSLAARSIRIQAPVPGHPVIGIEIPNAKSSVVTLREVLESDVCSKMKSPLKIALGKDVSGVPVMADLARMPHLLIAGATGSGKSVCLNSLISCLLFHNSPERLRLLMVDPKMVELSVFNDIPHLLAPVVTDVTKVTGTLKWALKEMHRRYKLFAKIGARNLARYNELQTDPKEILPFIVLIIDELADLMMVSPEDVEDGICRLAQLARATGMHLVLATQRPSVDVITGLIKANFPARIAFAVSSQVDSRTILDQAGAEKLLGRGDMLYQPSDEGKPVRVQGTYLSDREIEELVRFWKTNSPRTVEQIPAIELEPPPKEEEPDADDKLLNDAITVLREYRRASVSLLQRRLSIGYTRAARLLDVLEDRGVVGPSEDGRSRVVLDVAGADLDDGTTSEGEAGTDDDEAPPL
jgi:S-DNA-T family DNA segregation ATPase FtsK/SpoIIIE